MKELIIIFICIVLNAILSAFEMAFVSVSKAQARLASKNGNKKAELLVKLRQNPERTLSVMQIGITLVGALSAAVGGAGANETLAPYFMEKYNMSEHTADILSIFLVVIPLTYFSVVLGELVPKTFALKNPLPIALASVNTLSLADKFLSPIVTFLEKSTLAFNRVFKSNKQMDTSSEEQNINLSEFSSSHKQFIINLVDIEKKRIQDIMLPWDKVDFVYYELMVKDVLDIIVRSGHTRLPVVQDLEVVGVLHAKEFLSFIETGNMNWHTLIREPIKVSPKDELLKVLKMMQENKKHMAIVFSDSKNVGIVTLEDIIEEIIGEIYDEDDDKKLDKLFMQRVQSKKL